eukprot:76936-Lingulodinium_polyedra.AAC.1
MRGTRARLQGGPRRCCVLRATGARLLAHCAARHLASTHPAPLLPIQAFLVHVGPLPPATWVAL